MKIALLVGTRPEVIKMEPLIRECQKRGMDFILIHSNQHYSESMDAIFFKELNLPAPHFNLNIGSAAEGNQIGNIMIKLEPILAQLKPAVLLVQGDTNTVAAGAMVASKLGIRLGHVEAGLRSYDRTMPEEGNRVVTDHLSDYLFAVSDVQVQILKKEGISEKKIFKVGNTIVDSVVQNKHLANEKSDILAKLGLLSGAYTLFTAHRASNVDTKAALTETIELIRAIPGKVCWPIHLRTKKNLKDFELSLPENLIATEPLGYFDFLNLEQHAKLIVTDSGGIQEEACILGVPCITIRQNTERPETIAVGANVLIGRDVQKLHRTLAALPKNWSNPFGDGKTATYILDVIANDFGLPVFAQPTLQKEHISVVGLGYMGLPTASLLATHGYKVTGVDINAEKVERVNSGDIPFEEPGMKELVLSALKSNMFRASTQLVPSDVFIVAVPTPHENGRCDLRFVIAACESIAKVANKGNLIVIESTIKPNTCEKHVKPIFDRAGKDVQIVHCPERAIPGNTLYELVHNDRIIGGLTKEATDRAEKIYQSFVKGNIFKTRAVNAECAKLMENTFRDVNIALANEFSIIGEDIGFDVIECISLANRHPRVNILQPGPGVGGHCIPIDPWFLTEETDAANLITAARRVNDYKPVWCCEKLVKKYHLNDKSKIGILGVAYKKDVDDARETPAESFKHYFESKGIQYRVHDPHVTHWESPLYSFEEVKDWADVIVVVTDHTAFSDYNFDGTKVERF
jgi:UDP-N-acetylglucosamine 2-epimerase (non-hydrolysing)